MEPSPVDTLEKLNVCLTFAQAADGSHKSQVSDEEMQEHYDNFFQEVFVECEVSRSAKLAHLDQCDTGTGVLVISCSCSSSDSQMFENFAKI